MPPGQSPKHQRGDVLIQIQPRTRIIIDCLVLLVILALAALLFCDSGELFTGRWEWSGLLRAFFRYDPERGVLAGPLGTGLINTLRLFFWTTIFAGIVGLVLGIMRASTIPLARFIGAGVVAAGRNLPPLVLVFIIHFFLSGPIALAMDWNWIVKIPVLNLLLPKVSLMPVFTSALITMAIYEGAYFGEIVRAGIISVPKAQWESAYSLGFSRFACMRLIVLPAALRHMLPAITGQMTSLIKESVIVSVISVQELTFQGIEFINSSGMIGEVWLSIAACYLALCLGISSLGRVIERRSKHG